MPKCPKCGEEIDHLINYCKSWEKFYFDGEDYNYIDTISTDENEYACPECDETLFYNEEEAIEFLKPKAYGKPNEQSKTVSH
jgi:predicted RNA-binding Zn-ribbon protein involved in translation (DUF1610 family)